MTTSDRFPLQCDRRDKRGCRAPHAVDWETAREAFRGYDRFWPGTTLERMAQRGGFGEIELAGLLRLARDPSLRPRDVFPL